jgi:hypothetical protein
MSFKLLSFVPHNLARMSESGTTIVHDESILLLTVNYNAEIVNLSRKAAARTFRAVSPRLSDAAFFLGGWQREFLLFFLLY